jgi:hypothetical protein
MRGYEGEDEGQDGVGEGLILESLEAMLIRIRMQVDKTD